MDILYVLDCKLDTIGGSQKSTITTMDGISKDNNVSLLSQFPNDLKNSVFKKNIKYIFFKQKKNKYVNAISKMFFFKEIFNKNKYDIVHVQNTRFFVIIGLALKLGIIKKNNTRFLYTDRDFLDAYTDRYKKLIKMVVKQYDMIFCTTEINTNNWKKISPKNVYTIPNSLEDNWFEYNQKNEENIKKQKNVLNKINIGFSGRFVKYKRWDNVLKICNELKNNDNVFFSFAISLNHFEEEREFISYKEKLEKIINGKFELIINADREKMEQFYYSTDIFILTSNKESFGRTLIEAMAKKNVVFGTNSGGVPEVIENENFLFDVDNIDELFRKMKKFLDNKENLKVEAERFYEYANKKYRSSTMIEKYKKYYNLICK